MKNIIRIVFVLAICTFTSSCNNLNTSNKQLSQKKFSLEEKTCIEKVKALDHDLGDIRNHSCETISLSETIRNYTAGIEEIDFKDCPKNFHKAFDAHRKAWLSMLPVSDKYPDLRGEMHDLFKVIETGEDKEEFKQSLASIWETWGEVEKSMKAEE